jgi:predicted cupin superfamily sugar epimerase
MTAEQIIKKLKMNPLPKEGGYFVVTHHSDEQLTAEALPDRYQNVRSISGAIYYLVTTDNISALHKLCSDEIYYYHYGDPLEMLFLGPDGQSERKILGMELESGQKPQHLAPRNWWQGSRPLPGQPHGFSLLSTSMAPAYDESDVVFGDRKTLISQFPDFTPLITSLTRN